MASIDGTMLSSPDPLGLSNCSISSHSPSKKGRNPAITSRKALTDVSGNSQIQEFYIDTPPNPKHNASPRKSSRQKTRSTSPWRIRLTVQAEPVDEGQKLERSPTKRLTEQTTTITVPLKGGDDTPPAGQKRGRGRPRKSLDGSTKRAGTPKPKAGGRRKTISASPKKREVETYGETATPPRKSRGRPKKSMGSDDVKSDPVPLEKNDHDVWLGSSLNGGEGTAEKSKNTRTRSRGRRQEITPMKFTVDSDLESQNSSAGTIGGDPRELLWRPENRHDESDQIDQRLSQSYKAPVPNVEQTLVSDLSREQSILDRLDENGWRSRLRPNLCSPSPSLCIDDDHDQTDFDPTDQHQESDSILESEGFSMVSVSSLPSVGNTAVSPPQQYGSQHDYTPTITSSPSNAPAPDLPKVQSSPRQLELPSEGTPRLAKVVRAGIALQGVLATEDQNQRLGSPFREPQKVSPLSTVDMSASQGEHPRHVARAQSPGERSEDIFYGFGVGTRRELKAGLRLGEELAKRQQKTSQHSGSSPREADDVFQRTDHPFYPQLSASDSKVGYSLEPTRSETDVRYPLLSNNQLPSPDRSLVDEEEECMSWKAETPIKQEEAAFTSAQVLVSDDSVGPTASALDDTMMARKEEWQREREAVSKQIQMANKSQVIIIDSDDEDKADGLEEDVADSDIWQAEAQSVDRSPEMAPESDILLQPEAVKPRRSKIPSPWRRDSQVIYSDEMEPTEPDLFWQPQQSQARASKRRNARRDRNQGSSDRSSTDPVFDDSLENTRRAEAQIHIEAFKAWPVEGSVTSNDEESNPAEPSKQILPESSIQNDHQATDSPATATPSKDPSVPNLTLALEEASMSNILDVSEKIATLQVTECTSVKSISQTSKDRKTQIDPCLFQKTRASNSSDNSSRPVPILPLRAPQSSSSWLSRLTAPIWSVFTPTTPLLPAATKEDILCSSPHEPLCQLTPWEECHFRALGPLYYGSLLYGAHLFPFNPNSPSARYCGAYVTTKLGWSRKISPEDCGITDAFMVLLDERGFTLEGQQRPGARWIDEGMVIAMCVTLWVGMVKRGEIEVDRSKGERIGLRDKGDRMWTEDDIDWAGNQSEYFERKRREFDGLPSWKKNKV